MVDSSALNIMDTMEMVEGSYQTSPPLSINKADYSIKELLVVGQHFQITWLMHTVHVISTLRELKVV